MSSIRRRSDAPAPAGARMATPAHHRLHIGGAVDARSARPRRLSRLGVEAGHVLEIRPRLRFRRLGNHQAGGHLGGDRSAPVRARRLWAHVAQSGHLSSCLRLCLFLPLLAQAFLVYYGFGSFRPQLEAIGLWSFFRDAFNCALFAFSLNTAAYQAEILRGAIESVPKGQWEGAASLGLQRLVTLRKVILPQALIVALRPYGNELILMVKGSAIVAIITVYDLMGITRLTYSRTFDFQSYLWAAIIYLLIVETLRHGIDWIERRITRHLKR